jgi:hypothetical protein
MSEFVVVVPPDWEQATDAMVASAMAQTGSNFESIQAWLDSPADLDGLGSALDEERFPVIERITDALIVQGKLFIKTVFA